MASGWAGHAGARHHGAHGGALSRSMKVSETEFLDFSQNINLLGAPPAALKAAHDALRTSTERYPDLHYHDLRVAFADYLGVSPDVVLPTNGGAEALFLAARLVAEGRRGEKALVLEPTFSEYAAAARTAGLEPACRVARFAGDDFRLKLETPLDLDDTAVVFLCNPNNPTGEALHREEVLGIAEIVREAGATLVVDEAFADFVPEISVARDVGGRIGGRMLVARSFTKFFGIPGLRLGCLVTTDTERAASFQPSWPVNAVAAAAGIAACRDAAFVERSLSEVERLRDELYSSLAALPDLTPYPGTANFLLVRGPERLVERLARHGVLVRGCGPFAGLGAGYFRVAVRGRPENARLLDALREEL